MELSINNETLKSIEQVAALIEEVKTKSFPELSDIQIKLGTVISDSVFLESRSSNQLKQCETFP